MKGHALTRGVVAEEQASGAMRREEAFGLDQLHTALVSVEEQAAADAEVKLVMDNAAVEVANFDDR